MRNPCSQAHGRHFGILKFKNGNAFNSVLLKEVTRLWDVNDLVIARSGRPMDVPPRKCGRA